MVGLKIDEVKVGNHITTLGYSDRTSYTVIRKTARMIEVQKDKQKIDREKWKADWHAGGFAGHVSNDSDQIWIVESDPEGTTQKIFAGQNGCLKTKGSRSCDVIKGAHPFYDHNF